VLGINGGEFVLLILVALVVIGPERLPRYAEQLGSWVRMARSYATTAKKRVTEEFGEDVGDVDWAALDPRRYDPRRIVREALLDDSPAPRPSTPRTPARAPGMSATAARAAAAAAEAGATGAAGGTATPPGDGATPPRDGAAPVAGTPAGTPFDDEAT
jgi:sec-independent protein translocase protein TatB